MLDSIGTRSATVESWRRQGRHWRGLDAGGLRRCGPREGLRRQSRRLGGCALLPASPATTASSATSLARSRGAIRGLGSSRACGGSGCVSAFIVFGLFVDFTHREGRNALGDIGCSSRCLGFFRSLAAPEASAASSDAGTGAPRRVSASATLFFQSERRKCSAALVSQRTASSVLPCFSCSVASSKATIPSRVFSNSSVSFCAASGAFFALRMRACTWRQLAMERHCSSAAMP